MTYLVHPRRREYVQAHSGSRDRCLAVRVVLLVRGREYHWACILGAGIEVEAAIDESVG